jgi:uncharacterized protein (DUF433 family)
MKMSRYALNLPAQLKQDAEHWASKQGVSLNQFILWAVAEKVGALKQQLDDPDYPQITYRRGAGGHPTPTLRGTGIRVQSIVVAAHDWGLPVEEVAREYGVSQYQVKEALAFYENHRQEIEKGIAVEEKLEAENV